MSRKILILGGNGFVGRYLADYLKQQYVITTASASGKNVDLVFDLAGSINSDSVAGFDCIINCVVSYSSEMEKSFDVNVKGTLKILEKIKDKPCHFINISSVSAMDENFKENSYSLTKHLSDEIIKYYQGKTTAKLVTLRFAQIYDVAGNARKTQPGLFFFAEKIKRNEPLTIFGDKNLKRSYIPVEVLCQCVGMTIEKDLVGEHDVIMNDFYSPFGLANVFSAMSDYDHSKISFDESKVAKAYAIPACSIEFIDVLEDANNMTYFKELFYNV
ncbi:MAG: SDR family oxidoreductase [Bacteroidota bacterium]